MPGWLKAGLIGGVVLIVLNLLGLISFTLLGCILLPLTWLTYVFVGVLAASYTPPPRTAGSGAGQGALAAFLAALLGGIVGLVVSLTQVSAGGFASAFRQIPPEVIQQLRDAGLPPELVLGAGGVAGAAVVGSLCCLVGLVFAAVLGAGGGALYAGTKRTNETWQVSGNPHGMKVSSDVSTFPPKGP